MLRCRGLIVLGMILVGSICAKAQRLPAGVRPEHYSLTITPDLAKARFSGSETIDVVLAASTKSITLNAAEIDFDTVRAASTGNANPEAPAIWQTARVTLDAAKQQATFNFAAPLPAGRVTLEIAYTGILGDKLRGFYLSKTKLHSYGVTQFESTDARRAFPCFDEPALKATFDVRVVLDAGDTAISNTEMVSDTSGPVAGKHTAVFATTPKMSTYLVAWLVGDFKCSEGKQDGISIRACATPEKAALTKFALQAAKWDLHYYDRYFGIKYPLAKLDLVAIPDFEAGAMENFGCITYRETEMLVDNKNGSLDAKKQVAQTVAHEIAHQWFGDLVTPAWWDDIWLNEGFATWMESKASTEWRPKWGYAEDAALEKDRTMDEDAGRITRAIRTRAETPAEIDELFDDIAYGKAGAVIAMVESWVGEDAFRKGVQAYLAAHAYGNATAEDFWNAQTQATGMRIDQVMRSFVDQPGVPLVALGGADANKSVTQRRFVLQPPAAAAGTDQKWTIPLCFTGAPCTLLSAGTAGMALPIVPPGAPFPYANAQDKGYYRTVYAADELKEIQADAGTRLSAPERIGLLGDQWALMRAGQGQVGDFLNLVLALKQDTNAKVIGFALEKLSVVDTKIATGADSDRLESIVRHELGPVYAAMGTAKHASAEQSELREELFEALGRARDPAVLAEADKVTKELFSKQKTSDPVIADAAVTLASENGGGAMYDALLKVANTANDPDLKAAALIALTRFETPELVTRTLDYSVSDAVRSQDSGTLIALLLQRRETQGQAWDFVASHWPDIRRKGSAASGAQLVEAAGSFCTAEKREAVADFFREHAAGLSDRTVHKSLDDIDACIQLRAGQQTNLRNWVADQTASEPR